MSRYAPLLSTGSVGYAEQCKTALASAPSGKQLKVFSVAVQNRSGGAIDVGLGVKFGNPSWKYGKIIAADTPDYTEQTSTIQAGTAVTFLTTTNNDGYLVQCKYPFNIVGMNVSNTATGGVFTYEYYNGSAYTTLTTVAVPAYTSTGAKLIVFGAPQDWAVGTTAAVGGDTSMYSILVRGTTAPGDTGQIDSLWVAKFLAFRAQVANYGSLSIGFDELNPMILEVGESIVPYFGTASASNIAEAFYAVNG